LGIDDTCAGLRIPSEANPEPLADGRVELLPGVVEAPETKVVVDGLPGREIVGLESPGTAATQDVEDSVEDLSQGVQPGASGGLGNGQVRLDDLPLSVGEVGLVCSSSHAR